MDAHHAIALHIFDLWIGFERFDALVCQRGGETIDCPAQLLVRLTPEQLRLVLDRVDEGVVLNDDDVVAGRLLAGDSPRNRRR